MSSIAFPSCAVRISTSTSLAGNQHTRRRLLAADRGKQFSCCPLRGSRRSQSLVRLDRTLKTRGYDRLASGAGVRFPEFVAHSPPVSQLIPSSMRVAEQNPGCDSSGYVARGWRGTEIHFLSEALFVVLPCVPQLDARGRC